MTEKLRHILIILFPLFFFIGCSYQIVTSAELESLCENVHNEIEYVYDWDSIYETKEYFQSPTETAQLKTGDCEDFSIYLMFLAKKELNVKMDFVVVGIEGFGYHALTSYEGVYYDPTNNLVFNELRDGWHEIITFSYDIIMLYATALGTKGIGYK